MLYIRTDMNDTIATGHIMRCLSIADAAKKQGELSFFILADKQATALLQKKGYPYFILNTKWDDMDSELPLLEKLIHEKSIKKLFIDSYQVTSNYLEKLTALTQTVYMDDINAFFYPVNSLICYAICQEKFDYPKRYKQTALYLGANYIPLREEFCNCGKKYIKPVIENLLLMSGGTDPYNILTKILENLDLERYKRIDVVCGIYNKRYDDLKAQYKAYENIYIHKAIPDIANYMMYADMAISAGGTTLYELCAVGTPTISYVLADNQSDNAQKFQEDGIIDCAGDVRTDNVIHHILQLLEEYHKNMKLRAERSLKMQKLVDGKGAMRIAEILKEGVSDYGK